MTTDARSLDTGRRRVIHPLRPGLHPLWPVLATALWIATLGNLALWRALYQYGLLQGWNGFIFAIGLGTALAALLVVLLGLLAWRRTLRPALVAALVTSAGATHFMLGYGVVIDRAMLVNVAQTHAAEAADLMTPSLLLTVSMLGLLPASAGEIRIGGRRPGWPPFRSAQHRNAVGAPGPGRCASHRVFCQRRNRQPAVVRLQRCADGVYGTASGPVYALLSNQPKNHTYTNCRCRRGLSCCSQFIHSRSFVLGILDALFLLKGP